MSQSNKGLKSSTTCRVLPSFLELPMTTTLFNADCLIRFLNYLKQLPSKLIHFVNIQFILSSISPNLVPFPFIVLRSRIFKTFTRRNGDSVVHVGYKKRQII